MKEVLELIALEQRRLADHVFLRWLGNSNINPNKRLEFVPSMMFFIMGFKDLLSQIEIENPKTKLEFIISNHCKEDLGHWVWYIEDLKQLGFDTWSKDLLNFSADLWSDNTKEARELIYKSFSYFYSKPSLINDLVLIEVMEATFGAFITPMEKCVKEAGSFNQLKFFGHIHHHAEENHSTGSWIEEGHLGSDIKEFEMSLMEKQFASRMIYDLFEGFSKMFFMWYENREKYTHINSRAMSRSEQISEIQ
ncbi:MAG: hypothetical protein N4A33_12455 [Bacteriovoracaceae bacterium]|jgi:hypothetical protein|nr:hypothetical protein [Bacteriovoracaceae bacterium]